MDKEESVDGNCELGEKMRKGAMKISIDGVPVQRKRV